MIDWIFQLDKALFFMINRTHFPFLNVIMIKASDFSFWVPIIAVFIAYRLIRGDNSERLMWLLGILLVVTSDALCARLLKPLFGRVRPYEALDGVYLFKHSKWIITDPQFRKTIAGTLSWPSCHATNCWSVTFYLFGTKRRLGLLFAPIALLISYSRIYLGVHYPLDCLGGVLVGAIWGGIFVFVYKAILPNFQKRYPDFF